MLAVVFLALLFSSSLALDCTTFDPSKIELITFDVFAALMDLFTSLEQDIQSLAPFLTHEEVNGVMYDWVSEYAESAGHQFSPSETGSEQPFVWLARTSLVCVRLVVMTIPGQHFDQKSTHFAYSYQWYSFLLPTRSLGTPYALAEND
jgi:hypothetical protein